MAFDVAWYNERIIVVIVAYTSTPLTETFLNTFIYQLI